VLQFLLKCGGSVFVVVAVGILLVVVASTALCGCLKQLTGPTDRLMNVYAAFLPGPVISALLQFIYVYSLTVFVFLFVHSQF